MKKLPTIIMTFLVMLFLIPSVAFTATLTPTTPAAQAAAKSGAAAGAEASVVNDYTDNSQIEVNQPVDFEQTFEASEPMRGFSNAGGVAFPAIPSFFGPDTPGHSYQRMELILPLKNVWKRWELEAGLNEAKIMYRCRYFMKTRTTHLKELSGKAKKDEFYGPLKAALEENRDDQMIFITAPPVRAFRMVGHITIWSIDENTTSFELMEQAGLLGMEIPSATSLLITGQGATKQLKTKGWGIGISHSTSTISDSQSTGTVSSGGTGYSTGKAGNVEYPWLQLAIIE